MKYTQFTGLVKDSLRIVSLILYQAKIVYKRDRIFEFKDCCNFDTVKRSIS